MKHFRFSLANNWYPVAIGAGCLFAAALLLVYRLGSLTNGLSPAEYDLWQNVHINGLSFLDIMRSSVFLPYKLCLWVMQYLPFHGNGALRLPGVLFALAGVVGFFVLLKRWYSLRVAFFGTALFLTSSWLLHVGRLASPLAVYAASAILLALWALVLSGRYQRTVLPAFCVVAVLALYIPGALWVLLPGLVWQRKNLAKALRRVSLGYGTATLVIALLLLLPLVITLVWPVRGTTWDSLRTLLALPAQLPSVHQFLSNLVSVPNELFISSRGDPTMHLGKLPLLDAFTTAMFVVGVYVYSRDWELDRTKFIFGSILLSSLLVGLGGMTSTAILMPFVYLIAIAGASYLLQEWLRVFPRNPFAKWLGVSLVVITVLAAMTYQLTNYFVAWPHAKETRSTFSRRL